jgi:uncharacterized membrane-anchored protein
MGFSLRRMGAAATMAALLTTGTAAHAEGTTAAQSAPTMVQDQAMSRAMQGIATTLMLQFAASLAGGASADFDPGPAIEQTIKGVLASRELDRAIEAMLASSAGGADASGMSPQMRAALSLVLRQAVGSVRREMAAEFRRD